MAQEVKDGKLVVTQTSELTELDVESRLRHLTHTLETLDAQLTALTAQRQELVDEQTKYAAFLTQIKGGA